MTYGLYSPDLKASSLQDVDLDTARRYQYGDMVICTERMRTYGFEVTLSFVNYWNFKIWRHIGEARLGFLHVRWGRLRYRTADKIVEGPKEKEICDAKHG